MTWFVILATVLVAGALLLVVPPMLGRGARRRAHAERLEQAEIVLAVLREQLAEIDADLAAGRLTEAEHRRARRELEKRALEEGEAADDGADLRPARTTALALLLAVPLASVAVYLAVGELEGLDPEAAASVQARQGMNEELTPERMAELVERLADRLEADPSDETGWAMLARSYMMLGDVEGGAATWRRIGEHAPDNALILADWADILVASQEGDFEGEPLRVIERALTLDPDNFKALALAGAAAFEREDFAQASTYWERILDQVPREDPAFESVVASINEARQRGGMETFVPEGGAAPAEAAGSVELSGRVVLAPEFVEAAGDGATVFIFVRAPEGGLPFAAIRLPADELPAFFDFADAARMNDAPLPERVIVAARVSASGDPFPQAGDLEGFSEPVAPGAQDVELVIDRVRE